MTRPYPRVSLSSILRKVEEPVIVEPEETYKQVTVRLFHKGVVLRGHLAGAEIRTTRQWRVRAGQILLSRIDARNGAIGLVPSSLDGAIVTNDFWAFDVDGGAVDPRFLDAYFGTPEFVDACKRASEGTTNRVRLQHERFIGITVPLPPLAEQRRIVARIEELAAKIEEAWTLRQQTAEEVKALTAGRAGQVFLELGQRFARREFGSFSPHVTSGPRNWATHYEKNGYRFYRAQDIGPEGQVLEAAKVFITPPPGEQGRSAMLQSGDLMLVITGATVGRCTVFHDELQPGFVNQHVAIRRLPSEEVNPEFVLWGLRSPDGQTQLLTQRYGQGKPGLNLSNIRALSLPFPPIAEQRRIAAELDAFQAKVQALRRLQAETAAELNALLPSILDKAFKGEL